MARSLSRSAMRLTLALLLGVGVTTPLGAQNRAPARTETAVGNPAGGKSCHVAGKRPGS